MTNYKICISCGAHFIWQDYGNIEKYERASICPDCMIEHLREAEEEDD